MTTGAAFWFLTATIGEFWCLRLLATQRGGLQDHVPETIAYLIAASIFYLISTYLILKVRSGPGVRWFILGSALVFRITVWPVAPAFSDDVYRYRWEGKLQTAGGNPYQAAPNDPRWQPLRDETFPKVVNPDFRAGYGPLEELLERWMYRILSGIFLDPETQAFWFKFPAAICDLGIIAVLWALLAAHGLPVERALIYAWSPLPIFEFWTSGHNDSLTVLLVLSAFLLGAKKRWTWAFFALSLAACAKIWPLILFPIFIGRRERRWQALLLLPVAAIASLPYWSDVTQNVRYVSGFLGGWRNNDSLFGVLLWLTGTADHAKYTAGAIVFVTAILLTLLRLPREKAALILIVVTLFVASNCHPWYLTWILPLLAIYPKPSLLLWTALVPLSYRVLALWFAIGEWNGSTSARWAIYIPVFAWLLFAGCRKVALRLPSPAAVD